MLRRYVSTAFLSGSLLFGSLVLAPSPSTLLAKAVGAFATVVAINGSMATVQTDGGEMFAVAKDSTWKVGMKLLCDRVSDGTPHYLDRCLPWQ
ncbi:MAG TPA: hypothetical protein VI542_05080 [Candidatus Tectomicrobia bacterium]